MTVKTKDITSTTTPQQGLYLGGVVLGFVGSIISAFIWAIGARYTIDGVIWLVNGLLAFLTVPYQIPVLGWATYALLSPIPVLCSYIEWSQVPVQRVSDRWWVAPFSQWIVWIVVLLGDGLTTFIGTGTPPAPDAPLIIRQIAASETARGVLAGVLTVGPEWLLRGMVFIVHRALKGKRV